MIASNYVLLGNTSNDTFLHHICLEGSPYNGCCALSGFLLNHVRKSYLSSDRHISKMFKSMHSKCSPILMLNQRHFIYLYKISGDIYISNYESSLRRDSWSPLREVLE